MGQIGKVPAVRLRTERVLPGLLFGLIAIAVIATLPQMRSAWEGARLDANEDFGLRWLRELMLMLILGSVMLERRFWQVMFAKPVAVTLMWLGSYTTFEVFYASYLGLPLIVAAVGLRTFEYLPLVLVGMMASRIDSDGELLGRFARYLRWFVLVEGGLAVAQALFAPPLHGVSPLGGSRAFGTFVAPNQFGVTMATCALVFAMAGRVETHKWLYLSGALTLLSGSRTAILGFALVLGFRAYIKWPPRQRWIVVLAAPVLAVAALSLASTKAISGREIDLAEEGRLVLWADLLSQQIQSAPDLLFGWGLGLGSSTVFTLFGADAFPGQFVPDSLYVFLLSSFGIIGLVFYLAVVFATACRSAHRHRALFFGFLLAAGSSFNPFEYFPQNALLLFLWGYVASASARYDRWKEVGGSNPLERERLRPFGEVLLGKAG